MGIPKIDTGPMTVEEFYAFTDFRPDEEKWELIEGEAVLNASPNSLHQVIVGNILFALTLRQRQHGLPWHAIPGIGVRISDISRPEPDVMVLPRHFVSRDPGRRDTESAIALFEIMSPSTSSRDLKWKRAAYTGTATLTHYVVVAPDAIDVVVFARDNGFVEQRFRSLDDVIAVPSLDISLPPGEIYHGIDLA